MATISAQTRAHRINPNTLQRVAVVQGSPAHYVEPYTMQANRAHLIARSVVGVLGVAGILWLTTVAIPLAFAASVGGALAFWLTR